jgi:hypothetical protein
MKSKFFKWISYGYQTDYNYSDDLAKQSKTF